MMFEFVVAVFTLESIGVPTPIAMKVAVSCASVEELRHEQDIWLMDPKMVPNDFLLHP